MNDEFDLDDAYLDLDDDDDVVDEGEPADELDVDDFDYYDDPNNLVTGRRRY